MTSRVWRAAAVLVLAALTGCAAAPQRMPMAHIAELARREQALAGIERWTLIGRVAVSDGRDGGSGRFEWAQDGDDYRIEIRAPVSQETWRLTGNAEQCQLVGVKPHPVRGTDPEELLARELGWRLPLRHMRSWVRGIAVDPRGKVLALDDAGRIERLEEAGWTIDYKSWNEGVEPPMPARIFAASPPYRVRLAIREWSLHREP